MHIDMIQNNKYHIVKVIVKLRGFFLFIISLGIPILTAILIFSLFNIIANRISLNFLQEIITDKLFLIGIQYLIFIILFLIIFNYKEIRLINFIKNEDWFHDMGKAFIPAIMAFGLSYIIIYILLFLIELFPIPYNIKNWLTMPNYGLALILESIKNENYIKVFLWFLYIVVLAPIYEEIIFRGFLQDSIEKIFKKYNLDIIIVSLIFSAFHIFSFSNALFAFIVGIFLSKQRKDTGCINSTIWIHSIINFTGLLSAIIFQHFNNNLK